MIHRRHVLTATTLALTTPAFAQGVRGSRTLVVLFTRSQNSRIGAEWVARQTGADLFEIRPRTPYPVDYFETVEQNRQEQERDARPALSDMGPDLGGYDTIYLAHPIWSGAMPGPVKTWLAGQDLTGKRVVPMISHGGYGPGSALDTLRTLAPGAEIGRPFVREGEQERQVVEAVGDWFTG